MQFNQLNRRELVTLLGGAVAGPLTARAQQASRMPAIGFLGAGSQSGWSPWVAAFVQRLRELGWVQGRNVAIEYRWAEGNEERYAEIATEFVRLNVDVIVTSGGAVLAIKQATSIIPIVFAVAVDPVGGGLVKSLARPGGNATGLSSQSTDLAGKRLEILREIVPGLHQVAALGNATYGAAQIELREIEEVAHKLGFAAEVLEVRRSEEIAPALRAIKPGTDALYVVLDPLIISNRVRINTFALVARLPAMFATREFIEAGGLVSYGPSFPDLFRRAGDYVDKILHGAKPAELPVEQPTKFNLAINLNTAMALGLTMPPTLLARADEVIE
jgi:putative ABC transport system substrate-binding protein